MSECLAISCKKGLEPGEGFLAWIDCARAELLFDAE